jgi:hypothetical protein
MTVREQADRPANPIEEYASVVLSVVGANECAGEPENEDNEVYRLSITKAPDTDVTGAPPTYMQMDNGRMVPSTEADFQKREIEHLADMIGREAVRLSSRGRKQVRLDLHIPESYREPLLKELNDPARVQSRRGGVR